MAKVTSRWAHGAEITGVAYSPDGRYLVTSADEFTINVFPQEDGVLDSDANKIATDEPVTCIVVTNDSIYTGSSDGMVRKYNLLNQKLEGVIVRYEVAVRCLAISPDENLLAVGLEMPDIKIVNMEDPEKCWSYKGHKKAINSLSFDPLGEFLISSSCDGTVIVWDLKAKDARPVEIITAGQPVKADSNIKIPVAWHPSNEFFVIGKEKDIAAHHRLTWKKSFTYRTGSENPIGYLSWSPNGKFLSASSSERELMVWQYKEKEKPLIMHQHKNSQITGITWAPSANRLLFVDSAGELSRYEDIIDKEKGLPFNPPKPDPLAGLFDDAAVEDHEIEDQEMEQEYLSENESLNDFIVDDDNSGYVAKKPASSGQKSALKSFSAKELHPRFHTGSTTQQDKRRFLGSISRVDHGTHGTISVSFHDSFHKSYHFTDNSNISMACLGEAGSLFASPSTGDESSTVIYKPNDNYAKSEWQTYLPAGEEVTSIALNAESVIAATSRGFIRVFSRTGIQTALFSVSSVISTAARGDMVLVVYHQGEPFQGSQNLGYSIYNVETGQRIQHGSIPVPDDTFITWLGFSEGGAPAYFDSNGVMYILNYYRRVDQGQWTPITDTTLIESNSGTALHYWPIGLNDEALFCIKCTRGETEPTQQKPLVTELPLKMPTLSLDTEVGQYEEGWLRNKILAGLNKDEKIATSIEPTDNGAAVKEEEMDKLVLRMINVACAAERTEKALGLTAMFRNLRFVDAAIQIARRYGFNTLVNLMAKVREIRMEEEEEKDPNADLELIMATPALATTSSNGRDSHRTLRREEEREIESMALQRNEPIKPNDPFGRRVKKDTVKPTGAQSGAGASPFKKKSGSGGFGVVKEADRPSKSSTERASDLFEATDRLAADEFQQRAQKEYARQEELQKKRKANNATGTSNGGQKTLSMFSKPGTSADAKRFKKQQDEDRDSDVLMDAEDFLDDVQVEEDEHDSGGGSALIPETQESQYLEDSIEETRGHLEKTRVASSLSPTRTSSSVLSSFKFNA
ncbi:hypothetical protein BGZ76_001897 [Entomortierella beljakovae]|nr:hypothetical protein BGZ76_001897 [Entomortierella beljakovae]